MSNRISGVCIVKSSGSVGNSAQIASDDITRETGRDPKGEELVAANTCNATEEGL